MGPSVKFGAKFESFMHFIYFSVSGLAMSSAADVEDYASGGDGACAY